MDLIDCNIFTQFSRWAVAILMLVYHMTVSLNRDPIKTKSKRTKLYIVRCYHFLHPYVAKISHRKMLAAPYITQIAFSVAALIVRSKPFPFYHFDSDATIFLKAFSQFPFESNTKASSSVLFPEIHHIV